MTDRIKGLVVTLERDIREDDVEPIIDAIGQLRGVLSVVPDVVDVQDHMARERIRTELRAKLYAALDEEPKP